MTRRALVLHTDYAGHDPADEREFRREAVAFAAHLRSGGHSVDIVTIAASEPRRERALAVERAIEARRGLSTVAFFCHGLRGSLQTGHTRATVRRLAEVLAGSRDVAEPLRVPLYACSTAGSTSPGGEGSFAWLLRAELRARGVVSGSILAHTTAGHTTRNAMVRILPLDEDGPVPLVVDPASERDLFHRLRGLLSGTPTGRWDVASMTRAEIRLAAAACEPYVRRRSSR